MNVEPQQVALEERVEQPRSHVPKLLWTQLVEPIDAVDEPRIVEGHAELDRGRRPTKLVPGHRRVKTRGGIGPHRDEKILVLHLPHVISRRATEGARETSPR